jgi:hypothetical protein
MEGVFGVVGVLAGTGWEGVCWEDIPAIGEEIRWRKGLGLWVRLIALVYGVGVSCTEVQVHAIFVTRDGIASSLLSSSLASHLPE